jgi:hypothetical protein
MLDEESLFLEKGLYFCGGIYKAAGPGSRAV